MPKAKLSSTSNLQLSAADVEKQLSDSSTPSSKAPSIFKDVIIKNYHPIWNVAFMSAGISSGVLFNFPYEVAVFRIFGLIMWGISLLLFIMINVFLVLKMIYFPGFTRKLITEIQLSVFLGPYSMGFSTMINMMHLITTHYDKKFEVGLLIFWFINFVLALLVGWVLVFVFFSTSKVETDQLNPQLVLPILPLSVCASCGSFICSSFEGYSQHIRLMLILLTYLLWANSMFVGGCFIGIFFWKMLVFKLPPKPLIFAMFAPIGLIGHGIWGILLNGTNLRSYLQDYDVKMVKDPELVGIVVEYISGIFGLFLISIGFFFTFLGVATLIVLKLPKFNKTYWIVPFPICAFSLGLNEFYKVFKVEAFRVVATIYATIGILLVLMCLGGSVLYEIPYAEIKAHRRGL